MKQKKQKNLEMEKRAVVQNCEGNLTPHPEEKYQEAQKQPIFDESPVTPN